MAVWHPCVSVDPVLQLQHLVQSLERYAVAGGSSVVVDIYVPRYKMVVA